VKRLLAAATFAAVLALAACGSPGSGTATANGAGGGGGGGGRSTMSTPPGGPIPAGDGRSGPVDEHRSTATITIRDFGYSGDLRVEPGEDVAVVNKDMTAHTLTDKLTGLFDTGTIRPGGSATFSAPMKPGTYPFGCTLHPEMSGVLTVTDG
jgi:plastocyanin